MTYICLWLTYWILNKVVANFQTTFWIYLLNGNATFSIEISLFVHWRPVHIRGALVQIMAWCNGTLFFALATKHLGAASWYRCLTTVLSLSWESPYLERRPLSWNRTQYLRYFHMMLFCGILSMIYIAINDLWFFLPDDAIRNGRWHITKIYIHPQRQYCRSERYRLDDPIP